MKKWFIVVVLFNSFFGFSQSFKNQKRTSVKLKSEIGQKKVLKDSVVLKSSAFFKLKDTVGKTLELKIPGVEVSKDLTVYSKKKRKEKKKKKKRELDSWFVNQFHQNLFQEQQNHQNQIMQQQMQRAQNNMMRIP